MSLISGDIILHNAEKIKFVSHLKYDENINSISEENLLILYQLFVKINDGSLNSEYNEISLIKNLNKIKMLNNNEIVEDNSTIRRISEVADTDGLLSAQVILKPIENKNSVIIKEDKEIVSNKKNNEHIDLSKIKINKSNNISYSNIVKGKNAIEEEIIKEEVLNKEKSIKVSDDSTKNDQPKINFKDKEEFCKIVNEYNDYIIEVGKQSILENVDSNGDEFQFREITSEVMRFGEKLYNKYPGTYKSGYIAFNQIHYGPLNIKKDSTEINYNERNLYLYEKYETELGFKKAQKYFLENGYKLLDISDPLYKTREFTGKKSNNNFNPLSNRVKIILVNKNYIIKHENIDLWHGLNKLPVNKLPVNKTEVQFKDKKINKFFKKPSSKEEKVNSQKEENSISNDLTNVISAISIDSIDETSIQQQTIMSAVDAFEEKIIEKAELNTEENFLLIDDN